MNNQKVSYFDDGLTKWQKCQPGLKAMLKPSLHIGQQIQKDSYLFPFFNK